LQDPLMRERLTTPSQPTQLDLQARSNKEANGNPDSWFLRYRNREGQWCKSKMTTQEVLARLEEGKLTRNVEASRHSRGEFRALAACPEFRQGAVAANRPRLANPPVVAPEKPDLSTADPKTDELETADEWVTGRGLAIAGIAISLLVTCAALLYKFLFLP